MAIKTICRFCKSVELQKRGFTRGEEPRQRYNCRSCSKWFVEDLVEFKEGPEFVLSQNEQKKLEKHDRFIVTSAQNNTPINVEFWDCIKTWAKANNAKILVIPVRYKNPTSWITPQDDDPKVWWPEVLEDYMVENSLKIHPEMWVMGDVRIEATSSSPLSGLEPMSKGASAIYGHSQLQMKEVPTPQHKLPKILYATGSVSQKNYSKSKRGKKAFFHHTFSAVVVEKDKDKFHVRNVNFSEENKAFYDLDKIYYRNKVKKAGRAEALITGDEHAVWACPKVMKATYHAKDSIVNILKPKIIVRHDVFDAYSISHHHKHNHVTRYVKHHTQMDLLEEELKLTAEHIDKTTPPDTLNVIVASNHNEHLMRWLQEVDWKSEIWNAKIYFWFWNHLLDHAEMTGSGATTIDPFAFWAARNVKSNTKFLSRDDTFVVKDYELALHGDKGNNGARATVVSLSKIGVKNVTGHGHSSAIEKGATRVGTSTPTKLEYTSGPSSWLNSHAVIHPDGKIQVIHIIDADWRLVKGDSNVL